MLPPRRRRLSVQSGAPRSLQGAGCCGAPTGGARNPVLGPWLSAARFSRFHEAAAACGGARSSGHGMSRLAEGEIDEIDPVPGTSCCVPPVKHALKAMFDLGQPLLAVDPLGTGP